MRFVVMGFALGLAACAPLLLPRAAGLPHAGQASMTARVSESFGHASGIIYNPADAGAAIPTESGQDVVGALLSNLEAEFGIGMHERVAGSLLLSGTRPGVELRIGLLQRALGDDFDLALGVGGGLRVLGAKSIGDVSAWGKLQLDADYRVNEIVWLYGGVAMGLTEEVHRLSQAPFFIGWPAIGEPGNGPPGEVFFVRPELRLGATVAVAFELSQLPADTYATSLRFVLGVAAFDAAWIGPVRSDVPASDLRITPIVTTMLGFELVPVVPRDRR